MRGKNTEAAAEGGDIDLFDTGRVVVNTCWGGEGEGHLCRPGCAGGQHPLAPGAPGLGRAKDEVGRAESHF